MEDAQMINKKDCPFTMDSLWCWFNNYRFL